MRLRPCFALAALCLALPAAAQGRWTDSFAVPGAYGGQVLAVVADGPGVVVVGSFTSIDGVPARGVARWTGAAWEVFGGGVSGTVVAAVRDPAGALWVGGAFSAVTQPDGTTLAAAGVARWTGTAWEVPAQLRAQPLSPRQGDVPVVE